MRKVIIRRTGMHVHVPWMHVLGAVQVPHESVLPQPSDRSPHVTFCAEQVVCTESVNKYPHIM